MTYGPDRTDHRFYGPSFFSWPQNVKANDFSSRLPVCLGCHVGYRHRMEIYMAPSFLNSCTPCAHLTLHVLRHEKMETVMRRETELTIEEVVKVTILQL